MVVITWSMWGQSRGWTSRTCWFCSDVFWVLRRWSAHVFPGGFAVGQILAVCQYGAFLSHFWSVPRHGGGGWWC